MSRHSERVAKATKAWTNWSLDPTDIPDGDWELRVRGHRLSQHFNQVSKAHARRLARDFVSQLKPSELAMLDYDTRLALLHVLRSIRTHKVTLDARDKLFRGLMPEPEFRAWEIPRTEKFVEKLRADPMVQRASRDWSTMRPETRLKVLRRVAALHARTYGYSMARLQDFYEGKDSSGVLLGEYSYRRHEVRVNTHRAAGFNRFGEVLDSLVHECTHALQDEMARRFRAREIAAGHPFYRQARIFAENHAGGAYASFDDNELHYLNQPVERHARAQGAMVSRAVLRGRRPRPAA